MAPRRLVQLTPAERRRPVAASLVRFVAIFAGVIGAYSLLPLGGGSIELAGISRLACGALLFVAVVSWEVRRIRRADLRRAVRTSPPDPG